MLSPHLQKMKEHETYSSTLYYTANVKKKLPLYLNRFGINVPKRKNYELLSL